MAKPSRSGKQSQVSSAKKSKRNPSTPLRQVQGRSGSNDHVSTKGHLTMADLLESTGYKQSLRSSSFVELRTAGLKIPSDKKSKKNLTMEELLQSTGYKIPALRRGQEVTGKVISKDRSEIIIDIGAKSEGIVFGREFDAVRDLASKLTAGDTVEATVVYPENDAGQVVLSLRKHSGDKLWKELEEKIESGEAITVTAIEANRGGIICEYSGLQGFLPAIHLHTQISSPGDFFGKTLQVEVIDVDRDANRLIFAQRKDAKELAEVKKLLSKIEIGQKYEGEVKSVLPFGVFVQIEVPEVSKVLHVSKAKKDEGDGQKKASDTFSTRDTSDTSKLVGLVHISEIAWEKVDDPTKFFKVGQKVEVMASAKDEEAGKLSLSAKQLAKDPFEEISAKYAKDQKVTGAVSKVVRGGVYVTLDQGLEGFVSASKIPPDQSWEAGKTVQCMVESVDVASRKITLVPYALEKPIFYR